MIFCACCETLIDAVTDDVDVVKARYARRMMTVDAQGKASSVEVYNCPTCHSNEKNHARLAEVCKNNGGHCFKVVPGKYLG